MNFSRFIITSQLDYGAPHVAGWDIRFAVNELDRMRKIVNCDLRLLHDFLFRAAPLNERLAILNVFAYSA